MKCAALAILMPLWRRASRSPDALIGYMLRRNPDAIAIVVVLLWTLAGSSLRPVIFHQPVAGIRLIWTQLPGLRCLTLPSIDLTFVR